MRKDARLVANNSDDKGIGSTTSCGNSVSEVTYGLGEVNEAIPTILAVKKPTDNYVAVIIRVRYGPFALPFMWPRPPQEVQLA